MKTTIFTRLITIITFLIAQLAIPFITLIFAAFLSIYLINLVFIQPDKLKYLEETYLYITITLFLTVVFAYISLISTFLNLIKFGKAKIVASMINVPWLITPEMRLYYYNLTGQSAKAIEIASKMILSSKMFMTKLLVSDAFYIDHKYKKAQKLINYEDNPRELDLSIAKKALIIAKNDKDYNKAIEQIDEAIDINKNLMVRNSEVKYFELCLIKAEIYLLFGEPDKALEILNPWSEAVNKYLYFYKAKYNAYFMAQYFLLCSQIFIKKNMDIQKVHYLLDKTIDTFPLSLPAKEAQKIKDNLLANS